MPLDLRRRGMHPQVLERQLEGPAVVKGDVQQAGAAAQGDLDGLGSRRAWIHGVGDSGRLPPPFQGFRSFSMGKGDRRTRRGKIYAGSFGKSRPKAGTTAVK